MPTSDWSIPTGKAITGATYIKDTDNYIAATIEDLRDWCNNANGTYTDWTLTGLRTDFVDVDTAQTITAVKTIDTLGAIDFTGGELRIGSTAVTSTAAELNILDGVTSTTAELNILDGVTAITADINKTSSISSGTYNPVPIGVTNFSSAGTLYGRYTRVGNVVNCTVQGGIFSSTVSPVEFSLDIPVTSNFTSTLQCAGVATSQDEFVTGFVESKTSTSRVTVKFIPTLTGTSLYMTFQYEIA